MHKHDPELIVSVAEELLVGDLAAQAAAEIAACPECSAELTRQRTALSALRSMPAPSLTADESARMRSAIADAVGMPAEPETVAAAPRRRRTSWGAIAVAAAGLAGILAFVPVLGLVGGGGDDAATDAATTVAATANADSSGATRESMEAAGADEMEEDAEMALTATTVASEAPAAPPEETLAAGGDDAGTTSTATAPTPEFQADVALDGEDAVREFFAAGGAVDFAAADGTERTGLACSKAAEERLGEGYVPVDVPVTLGEREAILYTDAGAETLVAFDLEDCRALLVLP